MAIIKIKSGNKEIEKIKYTTEMMNEVKKFGF